MKRKGLVMLSSRTGKRLFFFFFLAEVLNTVMLFFFRMYVCFKLPKFNSLACINVVCHLRKLSQSCSRCLTVMFLYCSRSLTSSYQGTNLQLFISLPDQIPRITRALSTYVPVIMLTKLGINKKTC